MNKTLLALSACIYLSAISLVNKKDLEKYHLQSGVNITNFSSKEFLKKDELAIDKLAYMNFSSLTINDVFYQENVSSEVIQETNYFNDKYLSDLVLYSKKEFLLTLRHLLNSKDKKSRTKIMPKDISLWSKNYNGSVVDMAKKAKTFNIKEIDIGAELDSLILTKPFVFELAIEAIKNSGYQGSISISTVFSGESSLKKIKILNKLPIDKIGLDFYVSSNNDTLNSEKKFHEYVYYLEKIISTSEKPIEFREIGFRSVKNGEKRTMFNFKQKDSLNYEIQKTCYKNFYKAIDFIDSKKITGVNIWVTDTHEFSQDILDKPILRKGDIWEIGYSPFNKPAEKEIEKFNKETRLYKKVLN